MLCVSICRLEAGFFRGFSNSTWWGLCISEPGGVFYWLNFNGVVAIELIYN